MGRVKSSYFPLRQMTRVVKVFVLVLTALACGVVLYSLQADRAMPFAGTQILIKNAESFEKFLGMKVDTAVSIARPDSEKAADGLKLTETVQQRRRPQPEERESKGRMQERLTRVTKYCHDTDNLSGRAGHSSFKPCPLTSDSPRASAFCAIAKIGSTFWTRFYKVLSDSTTRELPSPFSVPLSYVETLRCNTKSAKSASPDTYEPQHVRAMFARDPFARLFSAYVDKLLSPNPIYWGKWGRGAMKLDGVADKDVGCGQNVTFRQFLVFVSKELHVRDNHVIPMAEQCRMCEERYDVVGNMETLPQIWPT